MTVYNLNFGINTSHKLFAHSRFLFFNYCFEMLRNFNDRRKSLLFATWNHDKDSSIAFGFFSAILSKTFAGP